MLKSLPVLPMDCGSQRVWLSLPSQAQIALALVTVRSRPNHLPIDEHLNNIRKCIVIDAATKGQQERKHIDIGRLWKDAFERSQQKSLKLQDEMVILRQQTEKNQGTVKAPQKRRTELSAVTKANTQSKRRKTEPHDHEDTDAGSGNEQDGDPFAKRILHATLALQRSRHLDTALESSTSTQLQALCRALSNGLHAASPDDSCSPSLRELCSCIASSYPLLLAALEELEIQETPANTRPQAVASIVVLSRNLLGAVRRLALDSVRERRQQEKKSKGKPRSNNKARKMSPEHENDSLAELSALLKNTMRQQVRSLDLQKESHCQVFKGMFSILLNHVGCSLSLLVFPGPDPDEDDATVIKPHELRKYPETDAVDITAALELEAPFLVSILKFTLSYLREQEKSLPLRCREMLGGTIKDVDNSALPQKIEKRLQDTLMRGVFGEDDEKFRDAFARPPTPEDIDGEDIPIGSEEEENMPEWFIGQVWELLGWDILSGEMSSTKRRMKE